jgi:hypothetical protein
MNYKDGKWAKRILELQYDDGSWGYFHSLSTLTPGQFSSMTTEQALRRLEILGYTIDDKPVKKAVKYLHGCLAGKTKIPDREEKTHNWKIYTELMLSTWIRIFTPENKLANNVAAKWRELIGAAFRNGYYEHNEYTAKYEYIFGIKLNPKAGRLVDFVHFYPISLLTNVLDKEIEANYFKYVLEHDSGMYYIYDNKLKNVPENFQSRNTSYYLRAIELLSKYDNPECKKQLQFVVKWLKGNMLTKNVWDMGKEAKDGIYLPLSDSWKMQEDRIRDCTYRISRAIEALTVRSSLVGV